MLAYIEKAQEEGAALRGDHQRQGRSEEAMEQKEALPAEASAGVLSYLGGQPKVWDKAAFEGLLREGEFGKALLLVRRMRARWPNNPSLTHAQALLESRVEGRASAGVLFEEACQAFLQGEKDVARRMFLTCRRMEPEAWMVRFNLSRLGLAQGTELGSAPCLEADG